MHTCYCTTGCQNGCEQLPPCDKLEVAIENKIERTREKLRCRLRQTLLRMRQEHLFDITIDEEGKEIWTPRTSHPRRK